MKNQSQEYYTPIQLKMPVEMERMIEVDDPVYSFNEVLRHMDLKKYFVEEEEHKTGRPEYGAETLLKVVLFAFMEEGYESTRKIKKLCRTDIRFMWLLDGKKAPSHMTISNFINHELKASIEEIFRDINAYIFEKESVDLRHIYIDGTKITANANRYTWVWKKSCETSRKKVFVKVSEVLEAMNHSGIELQGVTFGQREEYAIEYLGYILQEYAKIMALEPDKVVRGCGHRKSLALRLYDKLLEYVKRLKCYAKHIEICGEKRNSYSKTDKDATFMRIKRDYMGNDQLLPAYNVQLGICDEYIAVYDVKQYASDMDCFQPLMERFYHHYGFYPEYPVGDAGYGGFNNYLFCEEQGMKKYMKFPMYQKETRDKKYQNDPYRAVNFRIDKDGDLLCPNDKKFLFLRSVPVKGNRYGRTEELFQCEDCSGCPHKEKCTKAKGNRTIRLNQELTHFHQEVLDNLNCIHGALLRMNRSIQAEGAFGGIKWNRSYTRARRRGLDGLLLETALISCGFNLHKFYLKSSSRQLVA